MTQTPAQKRKDLTPDAEQLASLHEHSSALGRFSWVSAAAEPAAHDSPYVSCMSGLFAPLPQLPRAQCLIFLMCCQSLTAAAPKNKNRCPMRTCLPQPRSPDIRSPIVLTEDGVAGA